MRDDEQIVDQGEDFEVYERKRPRTEVRPGSVPDAAQREREAASAQAPAATTDDDADLFTRLRSETPTETHDPVRVPAGDSHALRGDRYLSSGTADAPRDAPGDAEDAAMGLLDSFMGATGGRDESPDPALLPDPPAEPMRVEPERSAPSESPPLRQSGAASIAPPDLPLDAAPPGPASANAPTHPSASTPSPSSPTKRGDTMRIAIAATEFNYDITHMMIERARAHAEFLGATITQIVRVPGVYDLPLAVKRLLARSDVDGVATLGVVIEGETDHDDLVIQHAARKIVDLSLESDKPVGLGITGPGMSRLQAEARIDRAKDAIEAIVKLQRSLDQLR